MSGLKAGTKAAVTAEPLSFARWPKDRAARRIKFIERYLVVPHGKGGGKPLKLREWQKEIIRGAYAPGVRTALVSVSRGNGKSALSAALAVAEMFLEPMSPQVLIVASDARQAGIIFGMARRMIELSPELAERVQQYRDHITVPHTDGELRPLPAEPDALHGWRPTLLCVDELHTVTEATWEAITSAVGKAPESLTLAISTPATSVDSIMWSLVSHGRAGDDPAFYLKEFAAPDGCDINDRDAWAQANPALGDFLAIDGMAAAARTLREASFRSLRLGQWVSATDAWLPHGAWDDCADPHHEVPRGTRIVLGFDGSVSGDSTALIGCTLDPVPHVFVVGLWENNGNPRWRVPRAEVSATVARAFKRYDVAELAFDPWSWRAEGEQWAKQFGARRCVEYNTAHASRMGPATDRAYAAIVEGHLTHDGDPRLAAHFAHTVAKRTPVGDLVAKDRKSSPRKIDAAVASIIALDRAAHHRNAGRRRAASF